MTNGIRASTARDASSLSAEPLLRLDGIIKSFGPVRVLHGVGFEVRRGEVHALIGENGAGKSTLMHILAGVQQPDHGQIDFDGTTHLHLTNPHHAQTLGIATVFQERSLFPHLSVAENIFAGRQPVNRLRTIAHRRIASETRTLLDEVGLRVKPDTLVDDLSPAQQQMVEVAKALSLHARLILFDEPTAALSAAETQALFNVIAVLQRRAVGVIYISHRLEEIFKIADCVTVLKDGHDQGTRLVAETSPDELVRLMVGRSVVHDRPRAARRERSNIPALEARDLSDPVFADRASIRLREISFQAWPEEILGVAGLAGSGRTETALSIIGARARAAGEILVGGQPARITSPAAAIAAGIGYLPEDRRDSGLFADMSVTENVIAASLRRFGSLWLDHAQQDEYAEQSRRRLKIACRDVAQPIAELSGGNQQKCILARWLLVNPKVLIVDEPTRGIDVGAKEEVHALLRDLAAAGTAVIVISSDLLEILTLCDRILVMRHGRVVAELDGATASEEDVMREAALESSHGN